MVLTFESVDEILNCDHLMKAIELFFRVVLFIMLQKVVLKLGPPMKPLSVTIQIKGHQTVLSLTFVPYNFTLLSIVCTVSPVMRQLVNRGHNTHPVSIHTMANHLARNERGVRSPYLRITIH